MGGSVEARDVRVHAVDGDGVLDEVVGADGEKIHVRRKDIRADGGGGNLDHDPDGELGIEGNPLGVELVHAAFQRLACLQDFGKAGYEREHHRDLAVVAGAEDGAELIPEHRRAGKGNTDAAPAEERVRLRFGEGFDRQLVAARVERADDDEIGRDLGRHPRVGLRLLGLVGHFAAVEEQEFRAVKAHPLRAAVFHMVQLVEELDVRGKRDLLAVERLRRLAPFRVELGAALFLFDGEGRVFRQRFRSGIEYQLSRVTVDHRRRECRHLDQGSPEADDGRYAEGAGEDGGVGVHAALLGGEAEQVPPVHRGGVGGREIVGEEDVGAVGSLVPAVLIDLEIPQHALADVLDVGGAFAEIGVGDAAHRLEEILHHRIKGEFRVLLAVGDGRCNLVEQGLVLQQHDVSLEDLAVGIARKGFEPILEVDQLFLGDRHRLIEAGAFVFDLVLGNLIDLGRGKSARAHMDGPDRDPGRSRNARVGDFL